MAAPRMANTSTMDFNKAVQITMSSSTFEPGLVVTYHNRKINMVDLLDFYTPQAIPNQYNDSVCNSRVMVQTEYSTNLNPYAASG